MMQERRFWVYVVVNKNKVLYVGMTNNLERRISEHKTKAIAGFTARYDINRLVYFVDFGDPRDAIEYEKKLKGWLRIKKVELVEKENPDWCDLAADWFFEKP